MLYETTLSNNDIHSFSNDYNNNSETTQSEIYTEVKEIRERKFEKKEVVHHRPFTIFFGRNHTHASIFHVTFSEERIVKTFKNGEVICTDWSIVQGSQTCKKIKDFQEDGWTDGYEIEITKN